MKQINSLKAGFSGIFMVVIFALLGVAIVLASGVVDLDKVSLPFSDDVAENTSVEVSTLVPESDTVDDIDSYLDETDVDDLDSEINSIEEEIGNL